jgi:hypothetical protein
MLENEWTVRKILIQEPDLNGKWHTALFWELPISQSTMRDILTVFMGMGTERERHLQGELEELRRQYGLL